MIKINRQLISGQNRPGIKLRQLRAIVIHWTANADKGATAMANRNYFNTTTTPASAHYIVDKNEIIQCIPDNEIAYHVGANQYKPEAMKLFDNNNPNNYTIGIEICNNDDWEAAVARAVGLTAYLLKKYNFTADNLMRHFDVTGKNCPAPMVSDGSQWELFKQVVQKELDENTFPEIEETQDIPDVTQTTENTETSEIGKTDIQKEPESVLKPEISNGIFGGNKQNAQDLLSVRLNKYDHIKKLEGIQHDPSLKKYVNFKQDYIVLIRKKIFYSATAQQGGNENYIRVYQINNFTNVSTSSNIFGNPGTCSIAIRGGERVVCSEKDQTSELNSSNWKNILDDLLDINEQKISEGINGDNEISFTNIFKAKESKYGWRFAEKADWEPMDEVWVFGKTKIKKQGHYPFLPIFFGYIDSVQKTYRAGSGGMITVQASDHLKILNLSRTLNIPNFTPLISSGGGIEINYDTDEFGYFIVENPYMNILKANQEGKVPRDEDLIRSAESLIYDNIFTGKYPYVIIKDLSRKAGIPEEYLEKRIEEIKETPFVSKIKNSNGDLFNAELKNRLQVCKEAAKKLFLEFFADEEGNIVLKIPSYSVGANRLPYNNLGVDVDTNEYKPLDFSSGKYKDMIKNVGFEKIKTVDDEGKGIIKYKMIESLSQKTDHLILEVPPEYILSFTLIDSDKDIYNMYEVQADSSLVDFNSDPFMAQRAAIPDLPSILQFGLRPHPGGVDMTPLVGNRTQAKIFGMLMIQKSMANRYSASLNMIEDSSIKIGNPIRFHTYDEHPVKETGLFNKQEYNGQSIYYITGINRTISPQNVSHMTLSLQAGRTMGMDSIYDIMWLIYELFYEEKAYIIETSESAEYKERYGNSYQTYTVTSNDSILKIINAHYPNISSEKEYSEIVKALISINSDIFGNEIGNNLIQLNNQLRAGVEIKLPKI